MTVLLTPTTTVILDGEKFSPEPAPCGITTATAATLALLLVVLVVLLVVEVVMLVVLVVLVVLLVVEVVPLATTVIVPFIHAGWNWQL